MVFSEIYGIYFNAIAKILMEALESPIDENRIRRIVAAEAFSESVLTIPEAVKNDKWPMIDEKGMPYISKRPSMPLTILQKRWLKGLMSDPRIQLFEPDMSGLEDVEPLFDADTFIYFDKYLDGDPYGSDLYKRNFKIIHEALQNGRKVDLTYSMSKGGVRTSLVDPYKLEYSAKDDKFRLLGRTNMRSATINLARILNAQPSPELREGEYQLQEYRKREVELLLTDERNTLERAMLHFSHFEKMTEKINDSQYRFIIRYDGEDDTELIIRVLSLDLYYR